MNEGREARVMALLKKMKESMVEEESRISCSSSTVPSLVCSCNAMFTVKQQERVSSDEQQLRETSEERHPKRIDNLGLVRQIMDDPDIPQSDSEESDVNLGSKVRRLKLFWDQFFLTETKKGQIQNIVEKEGSYPTLNRLNSRFKKRGSSKLVNGTTASDTRYKLRKKIAKEDSFSEVNFIPNSDVSTCVAKVSNNSESDFDLSTEKIVNQSVEEIRDVSQLLKAQLFASYISENDSGTSQEQCKKEVYHNVQTDRRMSCCRRKGGTKTMIVQRPTRSYSEGVAVRLEVALRLVRPNPRETEERVRKPRKPSTLLPCYYVSLRPDDPAAAGDAALSALNRSDKKCKRPSNTRTDFSYEKVCLNDDDGNARETTTRIQLTVSKDTRPAARSSTNLITYLLVLLTTLLLIVLLLFCFTFVRPQKQAPLQ